MKRDVILFSLFAFIFVFCTSFIIKFGHLEHDDLFVRIFIVTWSASSVLSSVLIVRIISKIIRRR